MKFSHKLLNYILSEVTEAFLKKNIIFENMGHSIQKMLDFELIFWSETKMAIFILLS